MDWGRRLNENPWVSTKKSTRDMLGSGSRVPRFDQILVAAAKHDQSIGPRGAVSSEKRVMRRILLIDIRPRAQSPTNSTFGQRRVFRAQFDSNGLPAVLASDQQGGAAAAEGVEDGAGDRIERWISVQYADCAFV